MSVTVEKDLSLSPSLFASFPDLVTLHLLLAQPLYLVSFSLTLVFFVGLRVFSLVPQSPKCLKNCEN